MAPSSIVGRLIDMVAVEAYVENQTSALVVSTNGRRCVI
jgi:hypothetical protein